MVKELSDNIFFDIEEAKVISIPTKTVLLEEGKVADRIFFIRKGCVSIRRATGIEPL